MTHKFKKLAFLTLLMAAGTASFAQIKVGGTPGAADSSAYIQAGDATGANKGFLNARVSLTSTTTWGLAGTTPRAGMMVYNTNAAITGTGANGTGMYYWDGTQNQWIWIKGAVAAGTDWLLNGNTNGAVKTLGTTDKYDLPFITNNVERMRIDTSGSVGIGTTTPQGVLTINANAVTANRQRMLIEGNSATNDIYMTINNKAVASNNGNWAYGVGATGNMIWYNNGTNGGYKMSMTPSGNVGIGTTTPGTKLEVNNGSTAGAIKIVDGTQGAGKVLTSDANGVATWQNPATSNFYEASVSTSGQLSGGWTDVSNVITVPAGTYLVTGKIATSTAAVTGYNTWLDLFNITTNSEIGAWGTAQEQAGGNIATPSFSYIVTFSTTTSIKLRGMSGANATLSNGLGGPYFRAVRLL